jgi:hypothetical protein
LAKAIKLRHPRHSCVPTRFTLLEWSLHGDTREEAVTETFFETVSRLVIRARVPVVVVWIVATVVAMLALPSLGSQVNSDQTLFLPASAWSNRAASLGPRC